jgi:hypothetical protein
MLLNEALRLAGLQTDIPEASPRSPRRDLLAAAGTSGLHISPLVASNVKQNDLCALLASIQEVHG